MAFLIRTIDFTAAGREIVRDRTIDQNELSIGRASENDIHLPDLAVEQHHVRLSDAGGGLLAIESVGGLAFGIDGRTETSAQIDPNVGTELSLGSSRLAISREGDRPRSDRHQASCKGRRRWRCVARVCLGEHPA